MFDNFFYAKANVAQIALVCVLTTEMPMTQINHRYCSKKEKKSYDILELLIYLFIFLG